MFWREGICISISIGKKKKCCGRRMCGKCCGVKELDGMPECWNAGMLPEKSGLTGNRKEHFNIIILMAAITNKKI